MADKQPEALRLAEYWSRGAWPFPTSEQQTRKDTAAELRRLHAEVEALRADATRYRWISKQFRVMSLDMGGRHCWVQARSGSLIGPTVDAAVDAAITAAIAASKEQ